MLSEKYTSSRMNKKYKTKIVKVDLAIVQNEWQKCCVGKMNVKCDNMIATVHIK